MNTFSSKNEFLLQLRQRKVFIIEFLDFATAIVFQLPLKKFFAELELIHVSTY